MNQKEKSLRQDFAEHVFDFELKGLKGRYWHAPALNKKLDSHVFVIVYGHHASLERNLGLAQYLRRFGQVIMPDLPGFGGMDSFYKVGKKPLLKNYAKYLDDFFKFKFAPKQTFSLIGFSFGFLVVTKFLQKYPKSHQNIRSLISVVGFVNGSTFKFTPVRRRFYLGISALIKTKPGAYVLRLLFLNRWLLRSFYARTFSAKHKFKDCPDEKKKEFLEMEIKLWHCNDVRTWAFTAKEMMTCDLTDKKVRHELYQLTVKSDQFLDVDSNKANLEKIYNKVVILDVELPTHAPTVIADIAEVNSLIPPTLVDVLRQEPL